MTIDINNIKIGDKVHLEFTVGTSVAGGTKVFKLSNTKYASEFHLDPTKWGGTANFTIVEHIPKPWVPAVGDLFKVKGSMSESVRWQILCFDPDGDWIVLHLKTQYKSIVTKKSFDTFERV